MAEWRAILAGGAALLLLAGCGENASDPVPESAAIIPCAVGGSSEFAEECIAELMVVDGERQIVVRHPDGAFRRFTVLDDGRGLAMADGADGAVIALGGSGIEVTVAQDRYRFPATIQTNGVQ